MPALFIPDEIQGRDIGERSFNSRCAHNGSFLPAILVLLVSGWRSQPWPVGRTDKPAHRLCTKPRQDGAAHNRWLRSRPHADGSAPEHSENPNIGWQGQRTQNERRETPWILRQKSGKAHVGPRRPTSESLT